MADLSDEGTDIVAELNKIMDKITINPDEASNPFYLDSAVIESGYTFDDIKLRATGFFKTLTRTTFST